jgi:hypothetical protein
MSNANFAIARTVRAWRSVCCRRRVYRGCAGVTAAADGSHGALSSSPRVMHHDKNVVEKELLFAKDQTLRIARDLVNGFPKKVSVDFQRARASARICNDQFRNR